MIKKFPLAILIATLNCSLFIAAPVIAQEQEFRGPISVQGKAFVDANGKRFMVRGVAVANSTDGSDEHVYDMLTDSNFAEFKSKILPKLVELNVNTIRVYNIDPTQSHDKAMNVLKKAGIFLTLELASPKYGENVNRNNPIYSRSLYDRYKTVIDAMHKYENVLTFSLGNEVIFPGDILQSIDDKCNPSKQGNPDTPECIKLANKAIEGDAAVLKSLARDMKAYMELKKYRSIPVGVSMQDSPSTQWAGLYTTSMAAQYYACGKNPSQRMDYVALNAYRYTNQNTNVSQYMSIVNDYQLAKMPIPFYLSETGGGNRPQAGVERDWANISWNYGILGNLAANPGAKTAVETYVSDLSGEIPFMLLNWKETAGLYDFNEISGRDNAPSFEGSTGTAKFGGAKLLAKQFAAVKGKDIDMPIPKDAPKTMACPENFNPPLLPNPATGSKIIVKIKNNFAEGDAPLDGIIVQAGKTLKTFTTKDEMIEVELLNAQSTLIQTPKPNYYVICEVPASTLKEQNVIESPQLVWAKAVPFNRCKVD